MSHPEEMEEYEAQEEIPLSIPAKFRELRAEEGDMTVRQLWERYMEDRLELQAEFQREYVWDDKRASRFVESLLLTLPVPPIFLAENQDGTHEVVDGHQRLESLFGFLQPLAAGPAKGKAVQPRFRALVLRDLEVLADELNGRNVSALSVEDRRSLQDRKLRVISIPRSANPDLKFVLFERLNLGSVPLNAQELRNCVYRGPYNQLIKELAQDSLEFFGRKTPHKRMRDRELVLRFFALSHRLGEYRTPFRSFLNDEMEGNRNCSPAERWQWKDEFLRARDGTKRVFGPQACRLFRAGTDANPRGRWDRWTDLIYDVEMVGFARYAAEIEDVIAKRGVRADLFLSGLRRQLVGVMVNDGFLRTLSEGTTRPGNVQSRHEMWDNRLAFAVQNPELVTDEADELRERLSRSNLCHECVTPIDSFEDAVSAGSNKLAHRFCSRKRAPGVPLTKERVSRESTAP